MQTLTLNYSERIPDILHETRKQFEKEAKMAMAVKLYENNRLPSGIASQLVGLDRISFLLQLANYNVPITGINSDDLNQDIENA